MEDNFLHFILDKSVLSIILNIQPHNEPIQVLVPKITPAVNKVILLLHFLIPIIDNSKPLNNNNTVKRPDILFILPQSLSIDLFLSTRIKASK